MGFQKFCPKCGKETDNIIGKECLECFLKKAKLFSIKGQKVLMCKHCSKIIIKGHWEDFSESLISEEVASKVKINADFNLQDTKVLVELQKRSEDEYEALVKVKGFISKNLVEQEKIIWVKIAGTMCDSCMKLDAEYREAIIQLRGKTKAESGQMLKIAIDLLNKERSKDSLSGTSKIIELKTGYDLWIGSKKAAVKVSRYMAKLYSAELKASSKLIGQEKSGKRKYRFTFCVKI
jgi:nonsense-mediated mRNA decay protein 3